MKPTICLGLLFTTFLATSVAKPSKHGKHSLKQKITSFIGKPKLHSGLEKQKKTEDKKNTRSWLCYLYPSACGCRSPSFYCDSGECIRGDWRCDNINDCADGSDECGCYTNEFVCDNGFCIPDSWQCDGLDDCSDSSDEKSCGGLFLSSSWWTGSSWWITDSSWWITDSSWWTTDSSWWTTGSSWWITDSSWWTIDSWWTTGSSWWDYPSLSEFSEISSEFAGPTFESPESSFGEGEACSWGEWSTWSDCSTDCGAGIRTRVRPCSCEDGCVGDSSEEEMCFEQTCDECDWGEWSPWSECNINCGAGTRSRDRPCPCEKCEGEESDIEACQKLTCNPEANKGCGTRKVIEEQMTRIVGGTNAAVGALPWQAMLFDGSSFTCGGTLIGRKYVLSAAHCFSGSNSPQSWKVNLGKQHREWNADPANGEFSAGVSKIIIHQDYNDNTLDNDIALMVLDADVPTNSDKINIACLDQSGERDVYGKSNCIISGWGTTSEGGDTAQQLQEAEVPIVDRDACIEAYDGDITGNMLCAGYLTGGIDSCQGDSGGPLVCPYVDGNDGEERWYLVGVTSWGYGCATAGYPGVYTNVANYLEWIKEKMANNQ